MDLFSLVATLGLDTSSFDSALDGVLDNFGGFGKLGSTATKLVGKGISKLASATVDFAKDVVETGMEVDKTFSSVQAVLGKNEGTSENMTRLMENAQKVAADSIFTLEETGDAYYYMGMAGWKTDQMLAGLPGVISLAAASGEDLGKVSDIVTDSLTAFGLGAGQASHFADVLAVAATNTNTDVARMGQTFKYLAPVAGALGYSVEDIATSIGLVANAGIKGSMAGTSLRNIFTRIATNAGATSKKLGALDIITEKLGVSFYDSTGKARPWIDVLTESREAWKKLDPSKADEVAKLFGDVAMEGQDAEQVMSDFANDLDAWTTEWNGFTTDAERKSFIKLYGKQFEALGISFYDSTGKMREFNDVAGEARIKLGGLTDEQKLYYSQQIGNLRGMTSWLAMMNASEEDFNQVTSAVRDAAGAAQDMANVKLDNLWGDIQMFNSHLDILKYAIFDDVKGPLRDVVQYATGAIERITEAVQLNGINGGIKALSEEIKNAGKNLAPLMESVGTVISPLVNTVIDSFFTSESIERISQSAVTLGSALGKGVVEGALGTLLGNNSGTARNAGWLLSGIASLFGISPVGGGRTTRHTSAGGDIHSSMSGSYDTYGAALDTVFGGLLNYTPPQLVFDADFSEIKRKGDATAKDIAGAYGNELQSVAGNTGEKMAYSLSYWMADGGKTGSGLIAKGLISTMTGAATTLGSILTGKMSAAEAAAGIKGGAEMTGNIIKSVAGGANSILSTLKDTVATSGLKGGAKMATNIDTNVANKAPRIRSRLESTLSKAGTSGGASMASNMRSRVRKQGDALQNDLATDLSRAGTYGGSDMGSNMKTQIDWYGGIMQSTLSTVLGYAGEGAGSDIVSRIQSALSIATFVISIFGQLFGSGGKQTFAKAQNQGRILRGATVFGVGANGDALVGGENGPEAVIGTGSLSRLITNAVAAGSPGDSSVTVNIYQQPGESAESLADKVERVLVRRERQRRAAIT